MSDDGITVTNDESAHQFEARVDGLLARLVYRRAGERVLMTHTEVPPAIERRGIGSALVRAALEDARAHRRQVVPLCSFVGWYIAQHPEYRDLLAPRASPDR